MTNIFTIGNKDFGIEKTSLRFSLAEDGGERFLSVNVAGNELLFQQLLERDQRGEFSWATYPPRLYLGDLPIPEDAGASFTIEEPDTDECEAGLYFMEHCFISDLSVFIGQSSVDISGMVDLMGKPYPFAVRFGVPAAA
ncbi:hypothetical protein MMG85_06185 [Pseudoxanthomonas sp. LH2527]|uniref:hypothetical protein n=1 Tax=Pseudoxanthomonas sp. LH2527 TaxID=2923249 RepID=UPI001F12EFE7|nr:hypothetical protein [Pseudoxanthomonas sp. LH2527]MCH6483151.1 hypothetical protein [Pseudoxanthomonas sp. LH2527]